MKQPCPSPILLPIEVTRHFGSRQPNLRARLEKIDAELGNLARFAAKTGRVDEAADLFVELEAERETLHAQLGASPPTSIDAEPSARWPRNLCSKLRRALDHSPDRGRSLFLSLLGAGECAWARIQSMGFESRASSTQV